MTRFHAACILSLIHFVFACHRYENKIEDTALKCGISVAEARSGQWLQILPALGEKFQGNEDFKVGLMEGFDHDVVALPRTSGSCVNIQDQSAQSFLRVEFQDRYRFIDRLQNLQGLSEVHLRDFSKVDLHPDCEGQLAIARDFSSLQNFHNPPELAIFQATASFGAESFNLFDPDLKLQGGWIKPAPGRYEILIRVRSLVTLPRFQNEAQKDYKCSIIIDQSPPVINVLGLKPYLTPNGDTIEVAEPQQILSLDVSDDNSNSMAHYCLYAAAASTPTLCAEGKAITAPPSGSWRLAYEAKDAAGNSTETKQVQFRIYDQTHLNLVADALQNVETSLEQDDRFSATRFFLKALNKYEAIEDSWASQDAAMLLQSARHKFAYAMNIIMKNKATDVVSMQLSSDGRYIWASLNSGSTRLYDLVQKKFTPLPVLLINPVISRSAKLFSGFGGIFLGSKPIGIYSETGEVKGEIPQEAGKVSALRFTLDDKGYRFLRIRGTAIYENNLDGTSQHSYPLPQGFFRSLLESSDEKIIGAADDTSGRVVFFKNGDEQSFGSIETPFTEPPIFLNDSKTVLTRKDKGEGKIELQAWNLEQLAFSVNPVQTVPSKPFEVSTEGGKVLSTVQSRDGKTVALVFDNQSVVFWNTQTNQSFRFTFATNKKALLAYSFIDDETFQVLDQSGLSQNLHLGIKHVLQKRIETISSVNIAKYSGDGKVLALNNLQKEFFAVSTQSIDAPRSLRVASDKLIQLMKINGRSYLASYDQGHLVIRVGTEIPLLDKEIPNVLSLYANQEEQLLIGTTSGAMILDFPNGTARFREFAQGKVEAICSTSNSIVTSNLLNESRFWDRQGNYIASAPMNTRDPKENRHIHCSPYEDLVAIYYRSDTGSEEVILHQDRTNAYALSTSSKSVWQFWGAGKYGYYSSIDPAVVRVKINEGLAETENEYPHTSGVTDLSVEFPWALTTSSDGRVSLWQDQTRIKSCAIESGEMLSAGFYDAEQNFIIGAADKGRIVVWDKTCRKRWSGNVDLLNVESQVKLQMSADRSWALLRNRTGMAVILNFDLKQLRNEVQEQAQRFYEVDQ